MTQGAPALLPHLHDSGEGPALLLLHALPQDASMWDHQVAALSGRHRCLRPDAFGCGASPAPPEGLAPDLDSWAGTLLACLDAAGVGRVAVAGSSMGGYLALALHRRAPERLRGLALISTRATADSAAARAGREAAIVDLESRGEAAVEALVEPTTERLLGAWALGEAHVSDPVRGRIRRCTAAGLRWVNRAIGERPDATGQLSAIAVPTLGVAGGDDQMVACGEMEAVVGAIPGARLEVLQDCGHLAPVEDHRRLSFLLDGWLDGLPA